MSTGTVLVQQRLQNQQDIMDTEELSDNEYDPYYNADEFQVDISLSTTLSYL